MDARVVEWVVRNAVGECVGSGERVEGEWIGCSSHPPLGVWALVVQSRGQPTSDN